jgi:hypothetical protein
LIPDFEALYNFTTDSQKTIVIKCLISDKTLKSVSFLPTFVDKKTAQPEILTAGDERYGSVIRPYRWPSLHILKRIEVYKGKVIFHSLSNFALELPFQFDKNLRGKQPS